MRSARPRRLLRHLASSRRRLTWCSVNSGARIDALLLAAPARTASRVIGGGCVHDRVDVRAEQSNTCVRPSGRERKRPRGCRAPGASARPRAALPRTAGSRKPTPRPGSRARSVASGRPRTLAVLRSSAWSPVRRGRAGRPTAATRARSRRRPAPARQSTRRAPDLGVLAVLAQPDDEPRPQRRDRRASPPSAGGPRGRGRAAAGGARRRETGLRRAVQERLLHLAQRVERRATTSASASPPNRRSLQEARAGDLRASSSACALPRKATRSTTDSRRAAWSARSCRSAGGRSKR